MNLTSGGAVRIKPMVVVVVTIPLVVVVVTILLVVVVVTNQTDSGGGNQISGSDGWNQTNMGGG